MSAPPRRIRFATLGPEGTNHHFVLQRYLAFHGLREAAEMVLVPDFDEGARLLAEGDVDFMLQVAVHPDAARIVGAWRHAIFVIDAFVSSSRPLAVVCRRDVERPRELALQPATRSYLDTARFERLVDAPSTAVIAQGLLAGSYEAGLTFADLVEEQPERFRVEEFVGTVDDAWMVFGREPIARGAMLTDRGSPAARAYAALLALRTGR